MQQPLQLRKQVPPQPSEELNAAQVVGHDGWQTHWPPEQKFPDEHWELELQLWGQLEELPLQR